MSAEHTPYLNLLRRQYGEDDEALRAAAGKIEALTGTEGWQILQAVIDEAHADATRNLILGQSAIRGAVPSQAEYARAVGFLAGAGQSQVAAESFGLAVEAMRRRNQSPE